MDTVEMELETVLSAGAKITPLVSVIVPIYNVEPMLAACLESICAQTMPDFEAILVCDGPTDGSEAIAWEFAGRDSRFSVICQENRGLSEARNAGMARAKGKYLAFVDSDDTLEPIYLEILTRAVRDGCMAICNYYECTRQGAELKKYDRGMLTLRQYLLDMARHPIHNYYVVVWNKLYQRSLVESLGLRFDPSAWKMEDFQFNMIYYRHLRQVVTVAEAGYRYRYDRADSLSHQQSSPQRQADHAARVYRSYRECWKALGWYGWYRPLVQFYGARLFFEEWNWMRGADRRYLYRVCLRDNGFTILDSGIFFALRWGKKLLDGVRKR